MSVAAGEKGGEGCGVASLKDRRRGGTGGNLASEYRRGGVPASTDGGGGAPASGGGRRGSEVGMTFILRSVKRRGDKGTGVGVKRKIAAALTKPSALVADTPIRDRLRTCRAVDGRGESGAAVASGKRCGG